MSSDILVRDQIFSTYDSLYDAEKKVADYLISHPSEAIEMYQNLHLTVMQARQRSSVFVRRSGVRDFIS